MNEDHCMTAPTLNNVYIVGKRIKKTDDSHRSGYLRLKDAIESTLRYKRKEEKSC